MSPQMVAKHVAYLEARLGTRLLNRTTRRQSLTPIGSTYYERCKLVLADAEWAEAAAEEARAAPSGRLRINAPVSFGTYALIPVVVRYLRDNPAVEIDLVLSDRFVDLIEEGYEAVFRIGPLADTSLMAIELRPFRLAACASPEYLR
jgi:DNA-binding transcriptional LysR family regulator